MKNSWLNEVRRLTGAQEGDCALLLFAAPRWSPQWDHPRSAGAQEGDCALLLFAAPHWSPQWDHPRSAGAQFSCLLSHDEPA